MYSIRDCKCTRRPSRSVFSYHIFLYCVRTRILDVIKFPIFFLLCDDLTGPRGSLTKVKEQKLQILLWYLISSVWWISIYLSAGRQKQINGRLTKWKFKWILHPQFRKFLFVFRWVLFFCTLRLLSVVSFFLWFEWKGTQRQGSWLIVELSRKFLCTYGRLLLCVWYAMAGSMLSIPDG